MDFFEDNRAEIFGNYSIKVEVIKDEQEKKVFVVVKDKGIGISANDVKCISEIGAGLEKNKQKRELVEKMPVWLRPAGFFGIGLQSVFQITDCIEFYTRLPNKPERQISLYSYGKNKGKIEVKDVPPNANGLYYDNAVSGTNVKIAINAKKLFGENSSENKNNLRYYDLEFDTDDELSIVYAEISRVCVESIKENPYDFFNISFQQMVCPGGDNFPKKETEKNLKKSYFYINKKEKNSGEFGTGLYSLIGRKNKENYKFTENMVYGWDKKNRCFYTWKLRPCRIKEIKEDGNIIRQVFLPEVVHDLYSVSYKFNKIINTESIYSKHSREKSSHAGFLSLDILILDDNPQKYLNIDRERLKEGAIDEDEIFVIRKEVLKKWCDYLLKRGKSVKAANEAKKRFNNNLEMLLSLFFLFYQNVSDADFDEFKSTFWEIIDKKNFVVGDERVPIENLWDKTKTFQTRVDIDTLQTKASEQEISADNVEISVDMVSHLPHRFINIRGINCIENSKLLYTFTLAKPQMDIDVIEMDYNARLWDYLCIFDGYNNIKKYSGSINFYSIIKKVLKPDCMFSSLVISKYPATFTKGKNFDSSIDYCINRYILSPFDQDAADILRLSFKDGKDRLKEFTECVKNSSQLKKCVNYVLKFRYNNDEEYKENILSEYNNFENVKVFL